jgi:alcohol dehydrogenase (cytochrome c)
MKKIVLLALAFFMTMAVISAQDWPLVNYDSNMSRNSPQTVIGKDNVDQLQVKWILGFNSPVEQSPLIVGKTGYAQCNERMKVVAFDLDTGVSKWTYYPNFTAKNVTPGGTPHGLAYENGVIYAPTGNLATVVALDANTGKKIWESDPIGPIGKNALLQTVAPPLLWKNYIIEGSAGGDVPPPGTPAKGTIVALDKQTGKKVWQIYTAVGAWVNNSNLTTGADPWSGGAVDMDKGVAYIPCGNAAPDFNATLRPPPSNYSNHVIAVNLADGKILWATPFVAQGNVFGAKYPDVHDYDNNWGTSLLTANVNGKEQKVVIGHNKRGDIAALDVDTGKPIWHKNLAILYNVNASPTYNGTTTWPGTQNGFESYIAHDKSGTIYGAVSNSGFIFYLDNSSAGGHAAPAFDMMPNGIGNGSIFAIDAATGEVKWELKADAPVWGAPMVTNGIVFCDHITATGKPYKYNKFAAAQDETPQVPTGILMALDAGTGKVLWQFNVGAPVGIGGPSISNDGMLLVPTGSPDEVNTNMGGYIVAFGLPQGAAGEQNAMSPAGAVM